MLHALQVFASVFFFFLCRQRYDIDISNNGILPTTGDFLLFTFVKVFAPESIFSAFHIECSNRDYKWVFSRGIFLFVFPL